MPPPRTSLPSDHRFLRAAPLGRAKPKPLREGATGSTGLPARISPHRRPGSAEENPAGKGNRPPLREGRRELLPAA